MKVFGHIHKTHICINIHTHLHTNIHTHTYTHIHTHIYIYTYIHTRYKIQDTRYKTRYKIFYFRYEAHSYNTIYIDLNNKTQCIIYNDKKYYINFSII